jgi:hypothetical protein
MRNTRVHSLRTRVERDQLGAGIHPGRGLTVPGLSRREPHEQLFQPVGLVAHADHVQSRGGQGGEDPVEILLLGDLNLDLVLCHALDVISREDRCRRDGLAQVEHECLGMQLAQDLGHLVLLDDLAVVDDGHVPAQVLGLLEVVGRQNDGGAGVDWRRKSHGAADLDVHARRRLVEDEQSRPVHQGAGDHQAALHAARETAAAVPAPVPELQLAEADFSALPGLA